MDNSTAVGIATKEFRQNKSKAMDMRFYWINKRIEQGQFFVFWRPGPENLRDCHSKHHPTEHHRAVRSKYLHVPNLSSLKGCDNLTIRVNPTKRESQRAKLEGCFLECVSKPLPLNSAQSMCARRRTWKSGHTIRYRQWNHMREQSADKQQTNIREPPIISSYQVDK